AHTLLYVVLNLELSWAYTEALTKPGHDLEDVALEGELIIVYLYNWFRKMNYIVAKGSKMGRYTKRKHVSEKMARANKMET
ncbi:hypothetical protein Tco_1423510, partial [Tanacetum coccineum]